MVSLTRVFLHRGAKGEKFTLVYWLSRLLWRRRWRLWWYYRPHVTGGWRIDINPILGKDMLAWGLRFRHDSFLYLPLEAGGGDLGAITGRTFDGAGGFAPLVCRPELSVTTIFSDSDIYTPYFGSISIK